MGKTAAITIDRLVKEDIDQVLAIERASFSQPWSRNLFLAEFRNRPTSLMLAALESGDVARTVLGYIVCWVFVDELHILDLATRQDMRRHGIAKELVRAALRTGYEWGSRKAFLEVRESNRPALRLYEKLGFERTQVREEYYDLPVENAIVMMLGTDSIRKALCLPGPA